ncbi:MAG: hypothetical protein EDQ89_12605 [Acidobacteria bacterium]|nr:MAG: hypothetical protein EDQ89_12605 [Acidobacteriota bacterium]MCL4286782.1 hypothetical protein [Thermoleophilia bacterium]GIK78473.1 MAG: hypothetical protein BroJett022_21630 [Actinomycetes bacterium]
MSRAAVAILAVVLGLAPAATATAGRGDVRAATSVAIDVVTDNSEYAIVFGSIDSNKPRCRDNRRVLVTLVPQSGPDFRFDVARTGGGGGWFALRPSDAVDALGPIASVRVEVARRKVPLAGGRALICGKARRIVPTV